MSDNTTIKFEQTKTIMAKEMGYDDWETCINDQPNHMVEQVMDKVVESYAEQHLEEVLGEIENDFKARIYITLSNTKTIDINATLKNQLVKEIWNTTKEALNLLKQRKG